MHTFPIRSRALPLLALLGLGCAEYDLQRADNGGESPAEDSETVVDGYLRVDVYPSDQNEGLLPETHTLDEEWIGLDIQMQSPVTLSGLVQGYDATPYLDINVPGSSVPVQARVEVSRPGTIMTASAVSDLELDGAYELQVARSGGYTFTVVPEEPTELPFHVEQGVAYDQDQQEFDVELGHGAPVYGWVLNESGLPLEELEIELWARDPETGTEGPSVQPDESGYYQLRVQPGDSYQIILAGAEGELVPTIRQEVQVEDDQGAELDFTLGSLEPISVQGQVRTADSSSAVSSVTARFLSLGLENHDGGELSVDAITNSQGRYGASLLPGLYLVEYIAPANYELSPQQGQIEVYETTDGDDVDIELSGLVPVGSQILAPGGAPLDNVTVVATERGFDGNTYTTSTGSDGFFLLDVPNVKLQFAFTPTEADVAVSFVEVPIEEFPSVIMLQEGEIISGTIQHEEQPVAFALVEVRDSSEQLYATTFTDESGGFEVRVLWDGDDDTE